MRALVQMTFASLVMVGGCVAETATDDIDGGSEAVGETQEALYSDVGGVGKFRGVMLLKE